MRILQVSNQKTLRKIMQEIKVDNYGIDIMLPKAIQRLVRINSLSCIAANILKQEMLSLGGDVAVARATLTGKAKKTDCLLMATLAQFSRLAEKLKEQPFGLDGLASDLSDNLVNYQRNEFTLDLGRHKLHLKGGKTYIMGIVNITPDSFSGDGLYGKWQIDNIIRHIEKMVDDGADIIDIGGESTRPGAKAISVKEEIVRTIPVIKKIAKRIKVPVSIDTCKPEVARLALDNGAVMVNDVSGLRNNKMIGIVSRYKAGVVIMHMQGNPRTMQNHPAYKSLLDEVIDYLDKAINRAVAGGIDRKKIIIDPGIGFGKNKEHNLKILKNLRELKILGRPILVGVSRKSFLGEILNAGPKERIFGTVSACSLAAGNGANMVRVHDVKPLKQVLSVLNTVNSL